MPNQSAAPIFETEDFKLLPGLVYDPTTRAMRNGYILVCKLDGVMQGDCWSLGTACQALIQSQQNVSLTRAPIDQMAAQAQTAGLLTDSGPGPGDILN